MVTYWKPRPLDVEFPTHIQIRSRTQQSRYTEAIGPSADVWHYNIFIGCNPGKQQSLNLWEPHVRDISRMCTFALGMSHMDDSEASIRTMCPARRRLIAHSCCWAQSRPFKTV